MDGFRTRLIGALGAVAGLGLGWSGASAHRIEPPETPAHDETPKPADSKGDPTKGAPGKGAGGKSDGGKDAESKPQPRTLEPVRRIKPSKDSAPPPARAINPISGERVIPGLEDADLTLKAAPLRGEGTFLTRQRGSLVATPTGEWAFIFHADEQGVRERPMVLLACQTLQRMQKVASERGERTAFLVSGQVFAYLDLNYLLPTAYSIAGDEGAAASPQGEGAARGKTNTAPNAEAKDQPAAGGDQGDPQLADLIKSLEAQRQRPRALERRGEGASGGGSTANGGAGLAGNGSGGAGSVLAEGASIQRRRGRLVRDGNGQWVLTFDAGPKGDSGTDAPITLMPCLTLQRMETWATQAGDAVTFTVSGNVYQHQGKSYLMPSAFLVNRPGDVSPRQ